MIGRISCLALAALKIWASLLVAARAQEAWTTLHGNVQRHGYYPHFPFGPFKVAWRKEFFQFTAGFIGKRHQSRRDD